MLAVSGTCTKCKELVDIMSPGMVCFECERYHHGHCMVPPQTLQMLENYTLTTKEWYCEKCGPKRKPMLELERRTPKEMVEIRKKLDTILDIREILIMIHEALQQMKQKCDELMEHAAELRADNEEMRGRLKLHDKHGNTTVNNLHDWRKQRKKLNIDHRTQVKGKHRKPIKKKKNFEKRDKLFNHLKRKHNLTTSKKRKKSTKDTTEKAKKSKLSKVTTWREELLYSLYQALSALSKSWRIQLILLFVLIGYTIGGATIFYLIEGRYEADYVDRVIHERNKILEEVQKMKKYNNVVAFDQEGVTQTSSEMLDKYYGFLENITEEYGSMKMLSKSGGGNWSFMRCIFFCTATYTTIGYGDIVPVTDGGKILTILYALIGIPLFFTLIASLGKTLVSVVKTAMHKLTDFCSHLVPGGGRLGRGRGRTKSFAQFGLAIQERMNIPLWPVLILQLIFINVGAAIFLLDFDWNFFISFYFIFITLTTIGFGDYVPDNLGLVLGAIAYIIFGLTLTAVTIHAAMEWMDKKLARATQKLEHGAERYYDEQYGVPEPSPTSFFRRR